MLIEQMEEGTRGSFFVEGEENWLAEMTYSLSGKDLMIIDHTKVADELRGKNIGYQLFNAAVAYARENNFKIFPICPFARSVFIKKGDELNDVLKSR